MNNSSSENISFVLGLKEKVEEEKEGGGGVIRWNSGSCDVQGEMNSSGSKIETLSQFDSKPTWSVTS